MNTIKDIFQSESQAEEFFRDIDNETFGSVYRAVLSADNIGSFPFTPYRLFKSSNPVLYTMFCFNSGAGTKSFSELYCFRRASPINHSLIQNRLNEFLETSDLKGIEALEFAVDRLKPQKLNFDSSIPSYTPFVYINPEDIRKFNDEGIIDLKILEEKYEDKPLVVVQTRYSLRMPEMQVHVGLLDLTKVNPCLEKISQIDVTTNPEDYTKPYVPESRLERPEIECRTTYKVQRVFNPEDRKNIARILRKAQFNTSLDFEL